MENIIEPTIDYDFTKLYFGPPSTLTGGAYFSRLMYNNNLRLYIQTPKSLTKQGFIKSGKKIYTDLMFDNNDTVFINWIENLETKCQELIHSKGETWFETKLNKEDIESTFTSPLKIFKSGKYYLLRVNVKPTIKIYDENNETPIQIENITNDNTLISILEIQGIKFTSRNFQIEIELKQAMIVSPDPFLDECFIKTQNKKTKQTIPLIEDTSLKENTDINVNNLEANSVEVELTPPEEIITEDLNIENLINKSVECLETKKNEKIDLEVSFEKEPTTNYLDLEEVDINFEDEVKETNIIEDPNDLKEVDLFLDNSLETLQLKKPNHVYYELYKTAREKAKEAKKNAIISYLEMKNIKKTYMLDDIESDSDSDFESSSELSDSDNL
jgi:hypothetical protein